MTMILRINLVKTAVLALLSISMTSVYAQKQTSQQLSKTAIEVAGTKLRLGMTKAQIAEKLIGQQLTKLNEDEWMLGSLEKDELGPTLQFTGGLLSYADREWTTGVNDVGEALFGAVSALNAEGFSTCTVTADTHASPTISAQRVWIICGEKTVAIIRRSFGGKSFTSVEERLGKWRDTGD